MTCTVDDRVAVRRAAERIEDCACCLGVDVLEPAHADEDCWTLSATLDRTGVPPVIQRELVLEGLMLHQRPPQDGCARIVATR